MYKSLLKKEFPIQLDCVAWDKNSDLLILGGYELDTKTSIRNGKIYLIKPKSEFCTDFEHLDEIDTAGVLDLKWGPKNNNNEQNENIRLIAATANSILLFEIKDYKIVKIGQHILEDSIMSVYVEWINNEKIAWSDTEGNLSFSRLAQVQVQVQDSTHNTSENQDLISFEDIKTVKCHDFSCWIFHYDFHNDIIYTGGDDAKIKAFYLKTQLEESSYHFIKRFDVGVTAIKSYSDGNLISVGSYDEKLRIFKLDKNSSIKVKLIPQVEIDLGGGVWRISWIPILASDNELFIAAACSKNGTHILKINQANWKWDIIASNQDFLGYLAYGLDFKINSSKKGIIVSSCYFENKTFQFWEILTLH